MLSSFYSRFFIHTREESERHVPSVSRLKIYVKVDRISHATMQGIQVSSMSFCRFWNRIPFYRHMPFYFEFNSTWRVSRAGHLHRQRILPTAWEGNIVLLFEIAVGLPSQSFLLRSMKLSPGCEHLNTYQWYDAADICSIKGRKQKW